MSEIRNIRRVTTYDASIPYTNNVQVNGADLVQVNGSIFPSKSLGGLHASAFGAK